MYIVKVAQSCLTLCNPMDYTVHGILQARILEWVAFPSPGDLPNTGIEPRSPTLQADSIPAEPQEKPCVCVCVCVCVYVYTHVCVCLSKCIKLYGLSMCRLFDINYTSTELNEKIYTHPMTSIPFSGISQEIGKHMRMF